MKTINKFSTAFKEYACEGDTITATIEGFDITARIVRDDCARAPDEQGDGFWPSKDRDAPGYVLPENYYAEMAKARKVMKAWQDDEWFYCGIVLSAERNGVNLGENVASLWGIECNYPGAKNEYLTEIANELLEDGVIDHLKFVCFAMIEKLRV